MSDEEAGFLFGMVCGVWLSPFWRLLVRLGNVARQRRNPMKSDLLKECVDALKGLRARMHEEPDAGVTAELDDVILRLERCLETASDDVVVEAELRMRALEVMARGVNAATNIAEIVRRIFGLW